MNTQTLKEKFLNNIDKWLEGRIDDMLKGNPAMAIPAVYMKRGCHNITKRYKDKIGDSIDKASLFFADENGVIDTNTLFADAMTLFKQIDESPFNLGFVNGTIGKGKLSITLPDNVFMNILFGSKKTITFDENDFMELKSLLLTN